MPVSAINGASWLVLGLAAVAVAVIGFTLIRQLRAKRRRAEPWTNPDRDASIRLYTSTGRQLRGARRSATAKRRPSPPLLQSEKLTKPGAEDLADGGPLASALGLTAHSRDVVPKSGTARDFDRVVSGDTSLSGIIAASDMAGDDVATGRHDGRRSADPMVSDNTAVEAGAEERSSDPLTDDDVNPLPSVPAWILEAQAALHGDDDSDAVDVVEAKGESPGQPEANADLRDEIKRLERKAKKARRNAREARDRAVKRARQNRPKDARAAALVNKEQRQRARKFTKRAEKLKKSLGT